MYCTYDCSFLQHIKLILMTIPGFLKKNKNNISPRTLALLFEINDIINMMQYKIKEEMEMRRNR